MSLQERIARTIEPEFWEVWDLVMDSETAPPEEKQGRIRRRDRSHGWNAAQAIINELGLVEERMTTGASMLEQLFNVPVTVTRRYITAWEEVK